MRLITVIIKQNDCDTNTLSLPDDPADHREGYE